MKRLFICLILFDDATRLQNDLRIDGPYMTPRVGIIEIGNLVGSKSPFAVAWK